MKIYKLDGMWLPDSAIECYNETGDVLEHCKGCAIREFTKRTIVFNSLINKNVELVDRESCPYFLKIVEANRLHKQLKYYNKSIVKVRKILDEFLSNYYQ